MRRKSNALRHRAALVTGSGALVLVTLSAPLCASAATVAPKSAAAVAATKSAAVSIANRPVPVPGSVTLTAIGKSRLTPVFRSYGDTRPFKVFDSTRRYSRKTVFTVIGKQGGYYIVNLAMRPNQSYGYVRSSDVTIYRHDYLINVSLSRHELTAFKGTTEVVRTPIAAGRPSYPTPRGVFFTVEIVKPKARNGPYGAYAIGLSGYSNVLTQFGRGDGQVAIHGTNEPQLLGQDVSHGCVRIDNDAVTKLVKALPLGVPVVVSD